MLAQLSQLGLLVTFVWLVWHHCLPLHACFVVNFVNFACCGAVQNITVGSNIKFVLTGHSTAKKQMRF